MARRPSLRSTDLLNAVETLKKAGMTPTALDIRPDGTQRWHFTQQLLSDEDDLDRELAAFEAEHGHGRA